VEYDILEHQLTDDQIAVYDAYADAWAIIHANLRCRTGRNAGHRQLFEGHV
jgi:hypothetical protein